MDKRDMLFSKEYMDWITGVENRDLRTKVAALLDLLQERGHTLGGPYVKALSHDSQLGLRELRVDFHRDTYRIFFGFDPWGRIFVCWGGRKPDNDWTAIAAAKADRIFERYLAWLKTQPKPEKGKGK